MSRIIVNNRSSLSDDAAVRCVSEVIKLGRISEGGYCFLTTFMQGHRVEARWRHTQFGGTDSFFVTDPVANKTSENQS